MESTKTTRRDVLSAIAAMTIAPGSFVAPARAQGSVNDAPGAVLFENEKVRVFGIKARPGQSVISNSARGHPPRLAVFMTDGRVKLAQGGAAAKPIDYRQGDLLWDAGESVAENMGSREVSVYLVEPRTAAPCAATASDSGWKRSPVQAGGKILFENDIVRVIEHAARPRMGVCGEGMHTHYPHLTIGLTATRIRIVTPDTEPVIREGPAGRVFWDESGPHAIQNLGSRTARALLIEIKTA